MSVEADASGERTGDSVYVVKDANAAGGQPRKEVEQRFVKLGPARGDQVSIVSGLKPGDEVDVRATASGGVYIERPGKQSEYRKKLETISKRRLIRDVNTDDFMKLMRGDPDEDPK